MNFEIEGLSSSIIDLAGRRGLGGTCAKKIMKGGQDAYDLWLTHTERKDRENLDHVLPVRIGQITESLNLEWYGRKTDAAVFAGDQMKTCQFAAQNKYDWSKNPQDEWQVRSDHIAFMVCSPDALCMDADGWHYVDAKHVGGWVYKDLQKLMVREYAQMQHNMAVLKMNRSVLSVFGDNNSHDVILIERDDEYIAELVARETIFWDCVINDVAPSGGPSPVPIKQNKLPVLLDMSVGNQQGEWEDEASSWLETREPAKRFADAAKAIKDMMPEDADECYGSGIRVKVSKSGSKTISKGGELAS
ncbi:MAG: hypothetical protein JKY34_08665 [Kordiimonadaceae bacterium]|nr:hypothetical protein [Kordiimonadaceae bacterium]